MNFLHIQSEFLVRLDLIFIMADDDDCLVCNGVMNTGLSAQYYYCVTDLSETETDMDERTILVDKTLTVALCVQHCSNLVREKAI